RLAMIHLTRMSKRPGKSPEWAQKMRAGASAVPRINTQKNDPPPLSGSACTHVLFSLCLYIYIQSFGLFSRWMHVVIVMGRLAYPLDVRAMRSVVHLDVRDGLLSDRLEGWHFGARHEVGTDRVGAVAADDEPLQVGAAVRHPGDLHHVDRPDDDPA